MGHKAVDTTCNISNIFGPGTADEHTVQWWFKKFCKGDESLEDEECSVQLSEADNDQLRAWLKRILLQLPKKLPKNSMSTILWSFGNWSKLEKWKSLIGGCLISWPQIKNIIVLKCVVFSYSVQQQCTTSQLDFDMQWKVDCIRQLVSQTCTQMRVMVTVWWSAAHLIHYSFLNPWQNQYIREVCSGNWWDAPKTAGPAVGSGQQKGFNSSPQQCPITSCTTNTSKVEQIGLSSFASSTIFTWPLPNRLLLL